LKSIFSPQNQTHFLNMYVSSTKYEFDYFS